MASERMSDEEIVRTLPEEALALLSTEQRAALDRILARLAAAERVCELVKVSLSPKLRQASEKKLHWWDVGIAVKEWEELAKP
jgi:hypothetical protein